MNVISQERGEPSRRKDPADLEPVDILYFHDGPILFTARIEGETRLVALTALDLGPDGRGMEYHVASPTSEMLEEVCANARPLRDAFLAGPFFLIRWRADGDATIESIAEIDRKHLPKPGALLVYRPDEVQPEL
ncbi:hypothetical protein LAZ40_02210 [Cereibacter sphaeroides]|uniref:hypothetical protein n=1 Tax=Cereibacter sphaeroides TaxID=1063 RepID=UPI001F16ACB6|nr:hypothetical protein [Cereibacter sphaeroides]MCE6957871.1 hypothetical protein [Cereibacter sphaeroides]MCE6971840.1 hypothetical protein [Cereibacter sphaeroides]